ncbi:PTS glucose transporter subunit IIA [Coriobacteriaceae bacterium]|uniref:PTS EIIA type-1 domain-containing protein n=1 Tax=Granulimonas faecalis TaxID=2894155 RepID=A0AAV5B178_9ACTN|nr:PTS glucose transporter subunit IIA [Granulimonas faecalis]MBF0599767.1 PTS glucose transporter subunit IIA [Atopobiaceae bacterium FL090493]TGY58043.1 PTS glucose transporter subunit IIA [Coriobacteriaceae bacterium]GJM54571.1 hypothetical protein ATOP_02260 [Granulimonas faecalis]
MGLFDRMFKGAGKAQKAPEGPRVLSPADGELVAIESVADPVFAEKTMGDGVAIVPVGGPLAAPVDGTLSALFPTGHAFGVEAGDLSVMVHGGIDTVDLEGVGFEVAAAQGDAVTAGQTVVTMDADAVRAAGYDPTVMVVVLEAPAGMTMRKRGPGPVKVGEPVIWFE